MATPSTIARTAPVMVASSIDIVADRRTAVREGIESAAAAQRVFSRTSEDMRRFFIGALVGAGLMYFYLYQYGDWRNGIEGKFNTVGSEYRGDSRHRQADDALR